MELSHGKEFEKAAPGMYLATIVDVVDTPNVNTAYGPKNRIRIHWVLAPIGGTGQFVLDKEGKPIESIKSVNASMSPRAELPKLLLQILGQAPPAGLSDTEQIAQLIIGRSSVMILVLSPNAQNPDRPWVNVEGLGIIQPGMGAPPPIPTGYIRNKNRPKATAGPNGQPVQTFASPQAAAQAQYAQSQYTQPQQPYVQQQQPTQQPQQPQQTTVNLNQPPAPAAQGNTRGF
jgi:hypothetical protein